MSDQIEYCRDLSECSRLKRARKREASARILSDHNVRFVVRNSGAHLIVDGPHGPVDFWPGTGLWIDRCSRSTRRRGVFQLVRYCVAERPV